MSDEMLLKQMSMVSGGDQFFGHKFHNPFDSGHRYGFLNVFFSISMGELHFVSNYVSNHKVKYLFCGIGTLFLQFLKSAANSFGLLFHGSWLILIFIRHFQIFTRLSMENT